MSPLSFPIVLPSSRAKTVAVPSKVEMAAVPSFQSPPCYLAFGVAEGLIIHTDNRVKLHGVVLTRASAAVSIATAGGDAPTMAKHHPFY